MEMYAYTYGIYGGHGGRIDENPHEFADSAARAPRHVSLRALFAQLGHGGRLASP